MKIMIIQEGDENGEFKKLHIKRRIKLHHRRIEGVVVEWFPYQKGVSVRYE